MWSDDPAANASLTTQSKAGNTLSTESNPTEFSGASILPTFIYTSKQYLGDISFILDKMGQVNSGSIANTTTLGADGTVTIQEYGNYILNNLKQSLEKMSGVKIDTLLSIRALDADLVNTKKLLTDELCIEGTCFTSTDLLRAIANSGSSQ